MQMGSVHPRVLAALGRALSLELTSVQQYITHACLADLWQLNQPAALFRNEAGAEVQHSERIIQCMLSLGVAPASSQLRPVSSAEDLEGLLLANIQLESDLIFHYTESMRFCLLISDHVHVAFFKSLLEEEQQHAAELVKWLKVLQDS